MRLQFLPLVHGNRREWAIPVLTKSLIAADAIGKQADSKCVFVGVVIALQDEEILCHQEGGPLTAIRHFQRCFFARIGEGASVGTNETDLLPFGNRE